MAVHHRTVTYKAQMKVSEGDFDLVLRGTKTCTIRLGRATIQGPLVLTDGTRRVRISVTEVVQDRRVRELSLRDARCEGMTSVDELRTDLEKYYGVLDPDQPLTVIHFTLVPNASEGL